jgi:hypothetical protein
MHGERAEAPRGALIAGGIGDESSRDRPIPRCDESSDRDRAFVRGVDAEQAPEGIGLESPSARRLHPDGVGIGSEELHGFGGRAPMMRDFRDPRIQSIDRRTARREPFAFEIAGREKQRST